MNDQQQSRADARTYTTQPAESVAGIALRQCGSEDEWRNIIALNPEFSEHTACDYFPVGTVLTLPPLPVSQPAAAPIVSAPADERTAFDLTDMEWLNVFERVSATVPNVFGSYMKVHAAFAREAIRMADEARATSATETGAEGATWYDRWQAECTRDHGEYDENAPVADRLRWWVPKSARHGSILLEDDLREAADELSRSPAMAAEAVALPYGHEFADMDGERHFKRGALPSYAQSNIVPLYAAPQPAQADAQAEPFPYQKTFNAIAAATSVEGGNISISVKAFRDAFGDAPAEACEPEKIDTKARMDWADGILRKLPPIDPTYAIISILDDHDPEDRDDLLHSIRTFADMRATQALFTLYSAPADTREAPVGDRMRWALRDFYRDARYLNRDSRITEAFTSAVARYFTAPPAARVASLTDEQWYDLASRHANADWNSDGYLAAVKALCGDYFALLNGADHE
ncbi:hypothetical protein WL14_00745 [Burkholderia cepacia]|uniref:hypothetical protein n=1 Tax=Burkholderia cepacia TaxID=292 RepID=UPI000760AF78|nr:hypothetical protein [Burkholderia cepacia]KVZ27005.1 hypothetical protein WL14_00745 [Burkholderia cepacia]